MKTNNPYTERLHDAIKRGDKELEQELRQKSDEYVSQLLMTGSQRIAEIQKEWANRAPTTTQRQQYKEAIRLYREALGLVAYFRQIKKDMRENDAKRRT